MIWILVLLVHVSLFLILSVCKQWPQPQQDTERGAVDGGGAGDVLLRVPPHRLHGQVPLPAHPGLHGTEHQQDRGPDHTYQPQGAVDWWMSTQSKLAMGQISVLFFFLQTDYRYLNGMQVDLSCMSGKLIWLYIHGFIILGHFFSNYYVVHLYIYKL